MDKENRAYKAHVLLLPYPNQGHVNPTFQFAKRLVSKGIKATLATTLFIINSVQFEPGSVGVEPISDGCDQGGHTEAGTIEAYVERLEAAGSQTLYQLIEKLNQSGHTISCLVYDAGLHWALDVAKRFDGLSAAAFFTQSCTVDSIYYHVYLGRLTAPLEGNTTVSLPGMPPLEIHDMPSFFSASGFRPSYLPLVLRPFSNLERADWVLLNTFDKLEAEVGLKIFLKFCSKKHGEQVRNLDILEIENGFRST